MLLPQTPPTSGGQFSASPVDRSLLILVKSYDDVVTVLNMSVGLLSSHRESRRMRFKTMGRNPALREDHPCLYVHNHICALQCAPWDIFVPEIQKARTSSYRKYMSLSLLISDLEVLPAADR